MKKILKSKQDEHDLEIPELTEEDFKRARRVTPEEHKMFKEAVDNFRRRGRPHKTTGKYISVTIRFDPLVLDWAKAEAKRRGIGYQTVINQTLLDKAA